MESLVICVFLLMVVHAWSLPAQNLSAVHKTRSRLRRHLSEEHVDLEDVDTMDKILQTNRWRISSTLPQLREGDIAQGSISGLRSAVSCPENTCLWPKSVDGFVYIPYTISPDYVDMDRITIETGMLDISSATCVKFVPRSHEGSYVDIQPGSGCWSYVGMTGGAQTLSLQSPGCIWPGVAAHELMHALGFVHEQSRSDRDQYVSIQWENILEGQEHNFKKYETNNLRTAYDYGSIMHYGRYAFSEDGGPTIVPIPDPSTPIGQREGPSAIDLHKINTLYECGSLV